MKKLSIIAALMVLLVTMTQCKKEEQPVPINENNAVAITLCIKGNGTRMDVNTNTGAVTYESGDVVYVASGGKYVGTLTHNGTNFDGTITDPTVGEPLHFYFLGNVTPAEALTSGTTTSCSVVISDQTEELPVIEYAPSNETYTGGTTTFTAMLLNKCALVKFNVNTASEVATCITGMNNKVTVDFAENTLTPSQEGTGLIKLGAGSGERWAILLPQDAVEECNAYSDDGAYTGICASIPAITENAYLTAGIDVNVTTEVNTNEVPVGAINGKFTINANGDQVYFSQGNLQYIGSASTPYWKFADQQWEYFGTSTGQNSDDPNVDRDLFGWGTSGWDNGNLFYQPYCTSSIILDTVQSEEGNEAGQAMGWGYGPTNGTSNFDNLSLTGQYANADWGVYNAIANGGNMPNQWRTLTGEEWCYLLFQRSTPSGIYCALGNVNGAIGVILLPDSWNAEVCVLNYPNETLFDHGDYPEDPYSVNTFSSEEWETLENNGAVFLPHAGYRHGSVVHLNYSSCYWTATMFCKLYMDHEYGLQIEYPEYRCYGYCVRLVQDAE